MATVRVTEILSCYADFGDVRPEILAAAAERGSKVHAACTAYARGLFVPRLDQELIGYFDSFQRWFDGAVESVVFTEERFTNDLWGFTGQPDLGCIIKGDELLNIWDYKTPYSAVLYWRCQLAAYKFLVENDKLNPRKVGRIGTVRLRRDGGKALLDEVTDQVPALNAFMGALQAYRYLKAA